MDIIIETFYAMKIEALQVLSKKIKESNFDTQIINSSIEALYSKYIDCIKQFNNDSIILVCLMWLEVVGDDNNEFENALHILLELNSTLDRSRKGGDIDFDNMLSIMSYIEPIQEYIDFNINDYNFDVDQQMFVNKKTYNQDIRDNYYSNRQAFEEMHFGKLRSQLDPAFKKFEQNYKNLFGCEWITIKTIFSIIENFLKLNNNIVAPYDKRLEAYCMTGKNIYTTYTMNKSYTTISHKKHKIIPFNYEKRLESVYVTPFLFLSNGSIITSRKLFNFFWGQLEIYSSFRRYNELLAVVKKRNEILTLAYEKKVQENIEKQYTVVLKNKKYNIGGKQGEIDIAFIDNNNTLRLVEIKYFEKRFSAFEIRRYEKQAVVEYKRQIESYYLFAGSNEFKKILSDKNITSFAVDLVLSTPLFYYGDDEISTAQNFSVNYYRTYKSQFGI
ncbi:MAG: hypothetical protein FWC80_02390 [Firmicutes bacterium]|nr:hypothetical protein [Bacillota bacterium]